MNVSRQDLLDFLVECFSIDEYQEIAYVLLNEKLSDSNKSQMALSLIERSAQLGQSSELLKQLERMRPEQYSKKLSAELLMEPGEVQSPSTPIDRTTALKLQIRRVLARTALVSDRFLSLLEQELAYCWVTSIEIIGGNNNDSYQTKLVLKIDWDKHKRLVDGGNRNLTMGTSWEDKISPEIDALVQFFLDRMHERSKWCLYYTEQVNLYRGISSRGRYQSISSTLENQELVYEMAIPELPELHLDLYMPELEA